MIHLWFHGSGLLECFVGACVPKVLMLGAQPVFAVNQFTNPNSNVSAIISGGVFGFGEVRKCCSMSEWMLCCLCWFLLPLLYAAIALLCPLFLYN